MAIFHRIDRIILWLLLLAGLFLCGMALTGENIPLSALTAATACLGLRRVSDALLARFRGRSRSARRSYARAEMTQWLLLPEAQARDALEKLVRRLPEHRLDEGPLIFLPLSPTSAAFDADIVLSVWRKNRGKAHVTLAALCPASAQARQWAEKLDCPTLSILDGKALEKLFVEACPAVPPSFLEKRRRALPADWGQRLIGRIRPFKAGLYALVMLGLYFLGGRLIHLAAFAVLGMLALLGIRRRLDRT